MAHPRSPLVRASRELALRALYATDLSGEDPVALLKNNAVTLRDGVECPGGANALAVERVQSLLSRSEEVEGVVQDASPRWKIGRMAVVDRNILRIGVSELLLAEIPPKDVIYDCVELAKQYGDKDSYRFVNGLLDQVCRNREIAL